MQHAYLWFLDMDVTDLGKYNLLMGVFLLDCSFEDQEGLSAIFI